MQASMSELVQFLEGRDDGVHQSTENEELMEPRSPSGREDSRALSKQLEDSNKLPPPSYIDELVFGFLGISEAEQNTAATSLCIPRDVVPSGRSAFKPSETKTYAIDGSNESYGGNWDEGLLENDYDYLSSYAHEVVITTETQSGTADKETAERLVANANDYSLDVLAQEKLDVQGFQVEEALHMASAPNVMCKSVIDTLQEDSTFFEDMGFDMRNSSELKDCKSYYESSTSEMNAEGSHEDVSPACSNLHIVPMSDGMMEVTASPPEEFAVPLSRDVGMETGQVSSPDVAKVPISTGVGQPSPMSPPTCQAVASTSQRLVFDISSCCGPFGAVVKNQIVLPYSGDTILSENDSLDSQDYGMPKLVRADHPPPRVADQIYDSPPELDPVDQPTTTTIKKGVKTTTSTLASAAGEDLLKSSKKITLDVVPESTQEATSQEELNDSLGKIVPSFTPDISNQMPAYMNDIYDVRNISLDSTCPTINAGSGNSLPLLPVTEEPKAYKTFKKVSPMTPTKKTKAPDVKSKDSCGVDKGFVRDLLRSVSGGPNSLSGPNCVVEFTNKAPETPSIRKDLVAEVSNADEKHFDSSKSETVVGTLLFNSSTSTSTKNLRTASVESKNTLKVDEASSFKLDFKSLPDLPTLLNMSDVRYMDKVPSNLDNKDRSSFKPTSFKQLASSEHLSVSKGKTVSDQSNKPDSLVQIVKKADITCNTSSAFTSSTSLKKTTTIIANVAQDVVNGVKVPVPKIIDDIKTKKSAQVETQDTPAESTSVNMISKKLMSPQELKVSLPISSLDIFSVNPNKIIETTKKIEVGYRENVNVILGVNTPTMAQRKQYAVPYSEADCKSSLTEGPTDERKNGQHLAKTSSKRSMTIHSEIPSGKVEVSDVLSPTKSLDTLSRSKILSKGVIGALDELTVCSQVGKNTTVILPCEKNTDVQSQRPLNSLSDHKAQVELKSVEDEVSKNTVKRDLITMTGEAAIPVRSDTVKKPPSSKVAPQVSDKIYITNENVGISLNAKMIKGLLEEINLTRGKDGPCSLNLSSKHPKTTSRPSNVVTEFNVHKKPICVVESLTSIQTTTKNCSIDANNLPNKITGTSKPISRVSVSRKRENIPSQIEKKVETRNKGESSSKPRTGLLVTNETEQTDSLKVHPVIDLVNSLIQSSSKLPDLFEEPAVLALVADEKQHTALSENVAVKEKTSSSDEIVEKLNGKPRNAVNNQKVKTSLDVLPKRKTTSARTAESQKVIASQDVPEKQNTSSPEKPKTSSSHSRDGKFDVSVSKEVTTIAQKSVLAKVVVEETKTTSQSEVQKRKSVARDVDENQITSKSEVVIEKPIAAFSKDVDKRKTQPLTPPSTLEGIEKQKLVTPSVVERRKTRASLDLTEKLVAPTVSQDGVIQDLKSKVQDVTQKQTVTTSRDALGKSKASLSQDAAEKKKNVLQDVVEKQKTPVPEDMVEKQEDSSMTEVSNVLKAVLPTDTIQKRKATSSQAMVDKSKTALSEGVGDQTKHASSHVVVLEQKTVISRSVVDKTKTFSSDTVVAKPKTTSSRVEICAMKAASSQVEVDQKKSASLQVVVENPKTTSTKVVVDKTETAMSKVIVEKTKMTPPQIVGGKHKEKVQDMVKKENTQISQDVVETKKSTFTKEEVSEKKHLVDKSKTVSSEAVAGETKTATPQNVAEKSKEKVQDMVEKGSTETLQETAKKKKEGAHAKDVVVERKPGVDKSKTVSSKFVVDKMKTTTRQDVAEKHNEKDQDAVKKESAPTSQEVPEKNKCVVAKEQVGERNPTVNKPKTALSKVLAVTTETTLPQEVAEEHKEKVQDSTEKECTQTSQEVLEKKKDAQSKEEIVERKPAVDKSKTVTSKVMADKTRTATLQDVAEKPKGKVQDTVDKESTQTLQEVVAKKKGALSKEEAVERKPAVDKSKTVSPKVVADKTKSAASQDVAEKPKEKLHDTVEKESTQTSQEVMVKKKGEQSVEEAVERKPAVDKSNTVSPTVVADKMKTTAPPNVAEKPEENVQYTLEKQSTRTLQEVVEKNKGAYSKEVVVDKPKTVSSKVVANEIKMSTTTQDVAKKPKEKVQDMVEQESAQALQVLVEKKKGAYSKEVVVERKPVTDKRKTVSSKVVANETKTSTTTQDVAKKTKEKVQDMVEQESAQALQDLVEKKKGAHSKEEVDERKPVVEKPKTVLSKVVIDNTKTTSLPGVAEKPKDNMPDTLGKESTRTLQEVVEKKKCEQPEEEAVERKLEADKPKTVSTKVVGDETKTTTTQDVAEKPKEKVQQTVEKESTQTLQGVVEKKKGAQFKEEVVERKPVLDKPKTVLSKVVIDNTKTTSLPGVAEKPKDNMLDMLGKESTRTLQEVVVKKKCEQPEEEAVEGKPEADKPKTVSTKVVGDETKTTTTQDVAEKPKEKVQQTVEKESTQTLQGVVEKKKGAQFKEKAVERKTVLDKPKTVSSKVVIDNTKPTSSPDVAEKPKEKMLDTVEKESTRTLKEGVELKKNDVTKEVVVEVKPLPSKKVVKKQKSASKDVDRTSSEDLAQNSKTAAPQGVVDKQKMISGAVNKKNIVGLKKSKSSDLLVGVVNSRTTKMVQKARQLSLESLASKRDILKVDKVNKPAVGHWRIVKQDKETASVENQSVSQSKVSDRAEEENKTRLRKRSETSTDGKPPVEPNNGHSAEKRVSTVSDGKPVESSDKVQVKQSKSQVAVDSKASSCKSSDTKGENKIRLRTRSETSTERKLKDDGSYLTVGGDEQESSNNSLPKQVVISDKHTTKHISELSSSISTDTFQKEVESSNKPSVKQSKKASSVDLKPLAQPNEPETVVIVDNKLRLKTRSETSVEKKVQDIKNSSNDSTKEPIGTSDTSALSKPAQNVDENAVSEEMNNFGRLPLSSAAVSNPVHEETKTRLRTRSGTNEKKLLDDSSSQSMGNDKQVSHNDSLAKQVATIDKTVLKHAKNMSNVDVKSPTRLSRSDSVQEGNKHRLRTRSETSSEKKLKKDDACSRTINQPLNTTNVGKISVNDVYDFIDDDAQSNIHTIDQFRNLSGKSMKSKRSPLPVSGALEPSVVAMEDENKLDSNTRKSRSENSKVASGRNSRKSSPKKMPAKKDTIVTEKVNKGNICEENKSCKSPERVNTEVRKGDGSLLSCDNHSGSKEGASTRSRSRDLVNDEGSVSPTRVLRSKVKQTVSSPAANAVPNHIVDSDVDSKENGSIPPEITSDKKVKATSKAVHSMPEPSSGKCDSTTVDTISSKHQSALTKNNENVELEDVENPLNRRKTRSSIKPTPKVNDNCAHESRQSSKANLLLPKLRSSVPRKLNGSSVTLTNEGGSVDSNFKQLKNVNSVDQRDESVLQKDSLDDDDSLSDTMSLKSEKVGDELKLIIKRVKKPVHSDKTDSSIASDCDIVQKTVRETSVVDVIDKEKKFKPVNTTVQDVVSELNQSTMLSAQDNTVCNAEAVSLKTPPMGSVVTPEPDNILAVNDMSQHREPEGAKSSTRTAQLRSLVLIEGIDRDGREHVSFQRDKDRGGKKRLARGRSVLDKKPNVSQSLEDLKNKPQNLIVDSPSTGEILKQRPHYDIRRNSSPSKTPKSSILESNKLETSSVTDSSNNETGDSSRRRVTRSSSTSATDSLVKSSKKGDLENECSKPRRGSQSSIVAQSAIKRNNDTSDSSGLKSKKVSKEANKQTGKRLQSEFENTRTIQDEVPVKSKLRKIEKTAKINTIEPESQSENSKIMSPSSKSLSNPDKKTLSPKGVVLRKSSVEPKNVEASNKIPELSDRNCSTDEVCLRKENTKKDVEADVTKTSTAQDPVPALKNDVPSKSDHLEIPSLVTPDESVASPVKNQKPEKSSSSRRKSKVIPPTKIVLSDIATGLIETGSKTSVKEVCLASESLDKILCEEDIKEVPSSFDILAQSPGKSPDSTTQSRADIVISKLTQEPLIVNTQKMSEDSQGVTSTTEIETMPIIVNKTQPSLAHETKIRDVGQGKKEDESVSSTTVDSKLCAIPYSDSKFVEIKKKNVVKASHTLRQSIDEPSAVRDKQPKKESIEKPLSSEKVIPESVSKQLKGLIEKSLSSEKVIPESVSKQLKGLDLEVLAVSGKKQSQSESGVGDNGHVSPEYDVLHPRKKIWRVNPDLNRISHVDNAVKMQSGPRENETSNLKSLSDEELKRTPLKKRQVWGIQVDNNVVNVRHSDERPRKEDKNTVDKSDAIQSPTSSVDQLRHSIYNILSVGLADKNTPIIQKADSRSLSKDGATSSAVRKTVENNCRKSSKKVCSNKRVAMKERSCKRRTGLRKSSRLMVSFSKKNGKTKVRKPTKKLKRVKPQRTNKLVEKQTGAFCGQPQIVVDKIFESPAKSSELETQKSSSSNDKETVEAVELQPKLVQNELVKRTSSNSLRSLLCNDTKPSVTIQNSLPVTYNYKELTVDPCEDEEASPQYSPLRPKDQDPVSQDLPIRVHSNFSGGFSTITPEWSKQSRSGSLIVPSASTSGGPFIVSPQATPVPRPIIERSRSFSSMGQTSKPRVRRESHPALPPAVQSPAPVDLSFRRKKSSSNGSTSHLGVNPKGLMIPTNIGKLDLNGQNPTFYTSFPGDIVTYDLAENQVVCLKPTNTTCINRPLDTMPPMNVPMSDQLNVTTASSSIPIRPIPIPNHKVRPAAIVAYPPLSGNKVKTDDFIPAAKSSFSDFSRYLYQQPLSAFHAMKSNNASSRNPIGNHHKKTDYNPLLFTHGTHFMLTPADISNMSSLCPSTSAPTLTPSRRNKSTRSNRAKPDVSSPASSKISFTNPKSHGDTGRSTVVRANETISQQPIVHQPEASCLSYYSGDSYNLGCVKNTNPPVRLTSLNTTSVLQVTSELSYKNKKDRNDKSLIGRNQEALQKIVREFNEGMNSIKDSNTVSNSKERSKSDDCSNLKSSDTLSVKNMNFTKCSEANVTVPEDVTATFNIAPANSIINAVEMTSDQLCIDIKNAEIDHCNTVPSEQTKLTEVLHDQLSKSNYMLSTEEVEVVKVNCESEVVHATVPSSDKSQEKYNVIAGNTGTTETLESVTKHMATNVLSVSENDSVPLLDEELIKSPGNNTPKGPNMNESSSIVSNEFCTTPDPVRDITSISRPTTESKGFGNQVTNNLANFKPEESCRDEAAEEQKILVTEFELSSDNLSPTSHVVPEELKPVPEHVETTSEVDQNINTEPIINEHPMNTDLITATETQVVSDYVEHETQPSANEPAVLLPETPSTQLETTNVDTASDNNRETDVHITEATETKVDKSFPTHCEQSKLLPKPETSTKPKIELPTENCELFLKTDDKNCLNKNLIEPVGTKIVPSAVSSSLTSIEQDMRLPTDQKAPEKFDACTDRLLSSVAACHRVDSVKSNSTGNETDVITTESQPQETAKQADSDSVNTSEVLKYVEFGVVSNPIHISESEETLVDVSDRLRGLADDKSALDSTSEDIVNDSSVNLDPITDLKSSNPIKLTELCSMVDIPIESGQSQEDVSKVSEAPDDFVISLPPQNSPHITKLLPDTNNPGLNSLDLVSDHVGSATSLGTSLPSPLVPNVSELNTPTEKTSAHSSTNKPVILVSASDSGFKESFNVSMSSTSNLKGEDTNREMEGANDGKTIDVGSSAVIISYRYGRKRKVPPDSEDEEDVPSNKLFDSSTCLTEKCKKVEAKVQIRPISPSTVDQVVRSGVKINHSELQDIVKCWQEYCRSSESVQQDITVGRAESDEVTKRTGREVTIRKEPRRPAGQSSRIEDLISRPSTSQGFRNESSSTLNRPSPLISKRDPKEPKHVAAYLLERELIKNEFIKRGQKRTCVRESFARGIKIYHRDTGVQNCGVEAFGNSSRRSSAIADAMCAITPARPVIHRSYSWILECLRERRKTMQTIESMNVQSCKDFINGVSKGTVAGCRTTSRDSLAVATHSRLSGSDVPPSVTTLSPSSSGATAITVISSESEDSNPGGTEHVMKDRDEVRKRIRRKVGSFVYPSCSCPSSSPYPNSNVCPTCRKERNHAQGASSPVQSSSTPLYTKVSNMQRREPERVMKCAAAVGGGEETVIVPDSDAVHLLKALMSLAGRRPPSSDTPITTYAPPCSLSCDDPVPTSHPEVFSLPYEKELMSPRVIVAPDSPLHDGSPHSLPEMTRGSSTRCLQEKPANEEAPCLFEGNATNPQKHSERGIASRSKAIPSLHAMTVGSSTSRIAHPTSEMDDQPSVVERTAGSDLMSYDSPSASLCQPASLDVSQVPPTQLTLAAEDERPSTSNSSKEANRLLSRIVGKLITPDVLVDIQRLLSGEPPSKKRKE